MGAAADRGRLLAVADDDNEALCSPLLACSFAQRWLVGDLNPPLRRLQIPGPHAAPETTACRSAGGRQAGCPAEDARPSLLRRRPSLPPPRRHLPLHQRPRQHRQAPPRARQVPRPPPPAGGRAPQGQLPPRPCPASSPRTRQRPAVVVGQQQQRVRAVQGAVGVRRGGEGGAAVQGVGVRVPDGAGDVHAQRPPGRLVPAVAVAAGGVRPAQIRGQGAAGAAAEQADDVRRGLAQPQPVGVHGLPRPVRHSLRPEDAHQVRQQRIAQRLPSARVQRDGGVLLGALPGAVQLGRPAGAQRPGQGHRVALHRKARRQLEGRPLPRLQHLHLVAQQLQHQSAEKQRCSVCGVEQPVRAGRPSDRVQGGAKDVGQVGGQAHRPQQNPSLLHGHVSQPLHAGGLGRIGGGGEVRDGDAADREPDEGGAGHRDGLEAARGGARCAAVDAAGARAVRGHHGAVGASQGRAHVGAHAAAGQAADPGPAGRPSHLRRLHPLVPPGPPRHLEPLPLRPHRRPRRLAHTLLFLLCSSLSLVVYCCYAICE